MTAMNLASATANSIAFGALSYLLVIADHDGDVGSIRRESGCAVVVVPFGLLNCLLVAGEGVRRVCCVVRLYPSDVLQSRIRWLVATYDLRTIAC